MRSAILGGILTKNKPHQSSELTYCAIIIIKWSHVPSVVSHVVILLSVKCVILEI